MHPNASTPFLFSPAISTVQVSNGPPPPTDNAQSRLYTLSVPLSLNHVPLHPTNAANPMQPVIHSSSLLSSQPHHASASKPRRGFDTIDFQDSDVDNVNSALTSSSSSVIVNSASHRNSLPISVRQLLYQIVDSIPAAVFFITLAFFDYCITTVSILDTNHRFTDLYRTLDFLTAIIYFLEVNARVYSYGISFYIHGHVRTFEYVLCVFNFVFVIAYAATALPWLLITRYIRILRFFTIAFRFRDRHLKRKTRLELQQIASLLETERSLQAKLIKWRIDSKVISLGELAGEGGFGTVYSGLFRGTLVAVKQISNAERCTTLNSIEDEAITLVNLRHPNVVLFMGFVNEPSRLWIVTEYCSRGSVRDCLDKRDTALTEARILKLALGAARGLAYLHGQQPPVLHLDLKTSNILISSGWDAKLADFGLSRSMDNIEKNWFSGTMQYAAPEILEANLFTTAADIYSFGICLWEMATMDVPYKDMDPAAVLWGVVKSRLRPQLSKLNCWHSRSTENETKQAKDELVKECVVKKEDSLEKDKATYVGAFKGAISMFGERSCYGESTMTAIEPMGCSDIEAPSKLCNNTGVATPACGGERQEEGPHDLEHMANGPPHAITAAAAAVIPPSHIKLVNQDAQYVNDDSMMHGSECGGVDANENESKSSRKKSHLRAIQVVPRAATEQASTKLNNLATRMTATIQMFDDRPPIIRRKDEEGSTEIGIADGHTLAAESAMTSSQRFHSLVRQTVMAKGSGRNSSTGMLQRSNTGAVGGSRAVNNDTRLQNTPFMRRLASFSRRTDDANKQKTHTGDDEHSIGIENEQINASREDSKAKLALEANYNAKLPSEYVELIKQCWAADARLRPSATDLVWRLVVLMDAQMKESEKRK